ncbi:hypothetical protein SCUCBS95973_009892 [Sporothrix curviconia]|uniref:HNH nuclease domain-containing protein n=1 Tax=Sporothrix curviconia TaxID=1260050 RepID=A0ABP0CYM8_9PEZI
MASGPADDAHGLLDQFLAQNPPAQLTDALKLFMSAPIPVLSNTTWLPPADEAATRLDLARQLRHNIVDCVPHLDHNFSFTAVQLAAIVVMPLDRLQKFVQETASDLDDFHRLVFARGFVDNTEPLPDALSYFLQGQHPSAPSKKRKTPGQDPQPVEQARGSNAVRGQDYVLRNDQQRRKVRVVVPCLARDEHKCMLSHSMHPEACHIIPFSFNSNRNNLDDYTRRFALCMELISSPLQNTRPSTSLITAGLGASDQYWNMLSISPYLHSWWAKAYWAFQCTGIESSDDGHAVVLVFYWMPHRRGVPRQKVSLEPGATDYQDMMGARGSYGTGRVPGSQSQGFANGIQHDSFRPIVSGQVFRVLLDTLEDAQKMKAMVDIQWACVRVAAMSAAAEPNDLDDDRFGDFPEFAFERRDYEFRVMLLADDQPGPSSKAKDPAEGPARAPSLSQPDTGSSPLPPPDNRSEKAGIVTQLSTKIAMTATRSKDTESAGGEEPKEPEEPKDGKKHWMDALRRKPRGKRGSTVPTTDVVPEPAVKGKLTWKKTLTRFPVRNLLRPGA